MNNITDMSNWMQDIDWNLTIFLVVIGVITVWSISIGEYLIPTVVLGLTLSVALQALGSWRSNR